MTCLLANSTVFCLVLDIKAEPQHYDRMNSKRVLATRQNLKKQANHMAPQAAGGHTKFVHLIAVI